MKELFFRLEQDLKIEGRGMVDTSHNMIITVPRIFVSHTLIQACYLNYTLHYIFHEPQMAYFHGCILARALHVIYGVYRQT